MNQDEAKREAAKVAVAEVKDGMLVGLGTGSTAAIFVDLLIERVRAEKLKIRAVSTSEHTARQAEAGGIEMADFTQHTALDVTFDGADVVDLKTFALLKGLGGALLREKIVAQASKRLVIMVDPSKIAQVFGGTLPIEIVQFGYKATLSRLREFGTIRVRPKADSQDPFLTDGGNFIADLTIPHIEDPETLQRTLKTIAGVIETGLFIRMAKTIIVGQESGPAVYRQPAG